MGLQESKWEALIFGTGAFIGILLLGGVSMELDTMQPLILSLGLVVAIVKLCNSPNQRFISLHLGTLRKSDLIPVLLFVLIHPNYDLYSTLQLGTGKICDYFVCESNHSGDHSFDFRDQDRPMGCPKYLCLNQDSSKYLCLFFFLDIYHPFQNNRLCVIP